MVRFTFILPLLGLVSLGLAQSMSKADADAICQSDANYGSAYEAQIDEGGNPVDCIKKPVPVPTAKPCFGERYTNPKDGSSGCCPRGQPYSSDPVSKEGACCSSGQKFSYDSSTSKGGCCAADKQYGCICSCKTKYITDSSCPGADGQLFKTSEGKVFKLFCGKGTWATNLKASVESTLGACAETCSKTDKCVAVDYVGTNCYMKSDGNTKDASTVNANVNAAILVPTPVEDNCVAPPPPAQPTAYFKNYITCPAVDGNIRVTKEGKEYKILCGKQMGRGTIATEVKKDIVECVDACGARSDCTSVDWARDTKLCYYLGLAGPPGLTNSNIDTGYKV